MSEIVLIFHFMIVLFFIAGFFIGLVWNQSMFRYIHAGCLGGITLLMVLRIPCPLTLLEESLRNQSYEGSFLATWLNRVLYLEWFDPLHVLIANVIFMAFVLSSFWCRQTLGHAFLERLELPQPCFAESELLDAPSQPLAGQQTPLWRRRLLTDEYEPWHLG